MNALATLIANPKATLRALDCLDARDDFLTYCGMIAIPTAPVEDDLDEDGAEPTAYLPPRRPTALHHIKLGTVLQAIDTGAVKRAMFFLPPGSAKSTYSSVVFSTYFLGRRRARNVILATYGSDLGRKLGRRARSIIKQPVYREIFATGLDPSSSAADEWMLENGNEFMAGGIRSGMTGNRGDLLLIDDPIKGREEADSETVRKRTLEAYEDDLLTRLKPKGAVLLIVTRWHEADLAGSILPDDYDGETGWVTCKDGLPWYVVNIPAQAERIDDPLGRQVGQYLWPEWFGPDHWLPFKKNARTWASLFQQRPRPAEGTYFQKAWFRRYVPEQRPKLSLYMSSDHAPGGSPDSDFSCVRVWGIDSEGDLWLVDGFRHQATMDVTAELAIELIRKYRPFAWFPEDDNNWKSAAGFIRRRMTEEKVACRIEPISPHGADKTAKAQAFQGMAAMNRVRIPVGPEGDGVIDEYLKFPLGKNDDEVDAAGVIGRAIDMAHPAILPTERPAEVKKRYVRRAPKSGWAT